VSASVALVGFMGAGKTTVGRALARRLDEPFVDSDDVVSAAHGPIPDIFARHGEARFREWEREAVLAAVAAAQSEPRVVSLGGGAVTIDDVREARSRLPPVVWLDAALDVLFARAREGGRPLAGDRRSFAALYETRRALYEAVSTAVVHVSADDEPEAVAARVCEAVTAP
jgi:shikimate kinase